MQIDIYNEADSVSLFGGGGHEVMRILSVSGLSMLSKKVTAVNYAGQNGRVTRSALFDGRTITIGCDAPNDESLYNDLVPRLSTIINNRGMVKIYNHGKVREAEFASGVVTIGDKKGRYVKVGISLECDSPYFRDSAAVPDCGVVKLITTESEFGDDGVYLSRLTEDITAINTGQVQTEPIITIRGEGDTNDGVITITNHTNGNAIILNYIPTDGETVTIDIPKRKITSSAGVSMLVYLDINSRLSQFALEKGNNRITIKSSVPTANVTMAFSYYNKYLEVV